MGYSYRTTDPQEVDFMSQLPANYMMQAIQTADNANDQQINQLDLLGNSLAKVNYLPADAEKVKAAEDAYKSQIDQITNSINSNPESYRQHMPGLRSITRDLTDNLSNGELAAYMGNANRFQQWDTETHKQVIDGKVTPEAYQVMRGQLLNSFNTGGGTAWNPNTKVGNSIATESMVNTPDIAKKIKEATDGIKANSSDWTKDQATGQWIFTNKGKNEQVEAARVANVALNSLISDPEVGAYLRQGSKYGYLSGAYDKDGTLISPFNIDKNGNPVWNSKSMLAAPIAAAVGRDAYRKVEQGQSMKDNPYGLKSVEFAHQEKMVGINDAYKRGDMLLANQLATDKEREMAITRTALGAGTSYQIVLDKLLGGANPNKITASSDGQVTISPFAGLDTNPDGSPKQVTSSVVNGVLLPASYTKMADLLTKIKDPSLSQNQRAVFQQQYDEEKANADKLANYSSSAHDYAVNALQKKGYNAADLDKFYLFNQPGSELKAGFNNSLGNINSELESLTNPEYTKRMNSIAGAKNGPGNISPYTDNARAKELIDQRNRLEAQMKKYSPNDGIGKIISDKEAEWFDQNRKTTNLSLNGVGLSVDNKNLLYNAFKANPDGVQVRDLNTDATKETTLAENEIRKIISNPKENLSDYLDIQQVNQPVAGMGVTITAKLKPHTGWVNTPMQKLFVHDAFKNNPYNKTILITLPDNVTHALGSNLVNKGTSTSEKSLGNLINSHSESATLSSIQNHLDDKDGNTYGTASIYDGNTGKVHALRVIPQRAGVQGVPQSYKAYVDDGTGNYVPFTYTYTNDKGQPILDPVSHRPLTTDEFPNEKSLNDALYGHLKYNQ